MNDYPIQDILVELRLNACIVRPSNASLALSLWETRDAILRTQEKIESSDRLIASISKALCRPPHRSNRLYLEGIFGAMNSLVVGPAYPNVNRP
jgi:hypothetical protein